jgi:sugar phosphate isomerase/epimerase
LVVAKLIYVVRWNQTRYGMGTSVITLCTGTRDPENMWRWHPENASSQAWSDLLSSMEAALRIAGEGILDYDQYVRLLQAAGFDGPLILHGLTEDQVDAAIQFLRDKLQRS